MDRILLYKNNAVAFTAGVTAANATSVELVAGQGVRLPAVGPQEGFFATFSSALGTTREVVLVTARSGDVLTVARGQQGTTPVLWPTGSPLSILVTDSGQSNFRQVSGGAIERLSLSGTSAVDLDPTAVTHAVESSVAGATVALPTAVRGRSDVVVNDGANAALVEPGDGDEFLSIATGKAQVPPGGFLQAEAVEPNLWRIASGGNAVQGSLYSDLTDAVNYAWRNRAPLIVTDGRTATLTVDPAVELGSDNTARGRHKLMMELCKWHGTCFTSGRSTISIRWVDGLHTLEAWDALGTTVPVNYCDASNPRLSIVGGSLLLLTITSIVYGSRGADNVYPVTVGVSTALPSRVVPGFGLGLRNVMGDNDAESATGGVLVTAVAEDRLSFSGYVVSPRTQDLVSPTTIDTTTPLAGLVPSRVCVPTVSFSIDTAYSGGSPVWNGGDHEGYWNAINGGKLDFQNIGITWTGSRSPSNNQDMIFARDTGTYVNLSRAMMVGSGERCVRVYGPANVFANQCCFGGGATAHSAVVIQGGSFVQLIRSSLGGFSLDAAVVGDASNITASGAVFAASSAGVRVIGAGATASIPASRVAGCLRGVYLLGGGVASVATNTAFTRNSEMMDFQAMSYVTGNADAKLYDAMIEPQGNFAVPAQNTVINGGGWYKDLLKPLSDPGVRVSLPANTGRAVIPLVPSTTTGGGLITAASQITSTLSFTVQANLTSVFANSFLLTYAGADVIVGSGNPAPTPGSVTVSVFLDVDNVLKLVIVNGQTAGRAWYLKTEAGNFALGTPVVT